MQKKTKYCNSLVSKVLPTINEIGDNNLIFNQIDNSLCFPQYKLGMSITDIFALTLPHSFELIGFWISGGIGLYIAWNIILFMYTDKMPTFKFYKNIGINLLIIFIIILSAAYIETYVSINMLT